MIRHPEEIILDYYYLNNLYGKLCKNTRNIEGCNLLNFLIDIYLKIHFSEEEFYALKRYLCKGNKFAYLKFNIFKNLCILKEIL